MHTWSPWVRDNRTVRVQKYSFFQDFRGLFGGQGCLRFRVWGLGFRVASGFRVWGLGLLQGLGFGVSHVMKRDYLDP